MVGPAKFRGDKDIVSLLKGEQLKKLSKGLHENLVNTAKAISSIAKRAIQKGDKFRYDKESHTFPIDWTYEAKNMSTDVTKSTGLWGSLLSYGNQVLEKTKELATITGQKLSRTYDTTFGKKQADIATVTDGIKQEGVNALKTLEQLSNFVQTCDDKEVLNVIHDFLDGLSKKFAVAITNIKTLKTTYDSAIYSPKTKIMGTSEHMIILNDEIKNYGKIKKKVDVLKNQVQEKLGGEPQIQPSEKREKPEETKTTSRTKQSVLPDEEQIAQGDVPPAPAPPPETKTTSTTKQSVLSNEEQVAQGNVPPAPAPPPETKTTSTTKQSVLSNEEQVAQGDVPPAPPPPPDTKSSKQVPDEKSKGSLEDQIRNTKLRKRTNEEKAQDEKEKKEIKSKSGDLLSGLKQAMNKRRGDLKESVNSDSESDDDSWGSDDEN